MHRRDLRRFDHRSQGVVHHQGMHTGIVDDEGEFLRGQAEIQGHENRPQRLGGEHGLQQGRVVYPQVTHPVAHADTALAQQTGLAPNPIGKFRIGALGIFEHQRPALRIKLRAPEHQGREVVFRTWSVHSRYLKKIIIKCGQSGGCGARSGRVATVQFPAEGRY